MGASLLLVAGLFLASVQTTDTIAYRTALLERMEQATQFSDFSEALFCYEATSDSITTAYLLQSPEDYEIPELTPKLTSFSYPDNEKTMRRDAQYTNLVSQCLSRFSQQELQPQEQLLCQLLQNKLTLSAALSEYSFYPELLGSSTGIQAALPVTLGEYPLRSEQDVQTYLALLPQLPDYVAQVLSYEEERNRLGYTPAFLSADAAETLSAMLEGFSDGDNSFLTTFEERLAKVPNLSEKKRAAYEKENQNAVTRYVIPSYEKIYDYLLSTLPEDASDSPSETNTLLQEDCAYGLSTLPQGTDYYSLLVESSTGSSRPVTELISMTEAALSNALGQVLNLALTDQKTYLAYCEEPTTCYYTNPETILEALCLMIRSNYPALQSSPSYEIKTVSDSLAASLSPAFYMIPPLDSTENNTIYINPLYTNEENGNLFSTLAHEGFPGHLYQTVYFQETDPDPLRSVLDYPGYVEGWATYVEIDSFTFLSYPQSMEQLSLLYQADTIISLALSSRIDLGVNYESWTVADTKQFLEDCGFQSYYAEDIYTYVVEAPANYLSYFIGYLELQELKKKYKNQEMEQYTEAAFHKAVLEAGPCDFDTLQELVLD
jgi:uncharacterized protein (DUF885 family)